MPLSADEFAASYTAALDTFQMMRPRSLQRELGVSSVGHCHSEALWILTGVDPTDAPISRQALMGTAVHQVVAEARKAWNPNLLIEHQLVGTLPSGVELIGNADEIDPDEPSVTDTKTVGDGGDLAALRKAGSTEQQRFQRHLYYYLAHQNGLVPAEGIVRNVWLDRAGHSAEAFVEQEPFDMNVVHAADRWLQDVLYAAQHGEEVPQDKHFAWCERFCSFFSHCRAGQTLDDLTITDPELVTAARLLAEGRVEEKAAKGTVSSARRVLEVLKSSDSTEMAAYRAGDYRVRWTWVNGDPGYWKCSSERVAA